MTKPLVVTEQKNHIGTILLNDPLKMNAFSQPLVKELVETLDSMWYDRDIRVIVIRGAGGNFSAGGDIKSMKNRVDCCRQGIEPATDARKNLRSMNRIPALIRKIDKPIIAWLEGAVAGGGLSLAMACDFSIADEACKLVFAFVNIGLAPDMGSSLMMCQKAGIAKASELFMTGRRFSARQAADWGIITEAVAAEHLEERVMSLAQKLATGPTRAYAAVKAALNRTAYSGLEEAMADETETQNMLILTEDHGEAVTAFVEKRPPVFCGK